MAAEIPKSFVVIGGVAGGMSFATRVRRLCEKSSITVLKRGPYTGYANCGIPYAPCNTIHSTNSLIL
jgi:hypothetical protein